MDVARVVIRAFSVFVFLLVMMRLSGKRLIRQGTPFDFVLALMMGDLIDDAIWADVPFLQFAVAIGTLVVTRLAFGASKRALT